MADLEIVTYNLLDDGVLDLLRKYHEEQAKYVSLVSSLIGYVERKPESDITHDSDTYDLLLNDLLRLSSIFGVDHINSLDRITKERMTPILDAFYQVLNEMYYNINHYYGGRGGYKGKEEDCSLYCVTLQKESVILGSVFAYYDHSSNIMPEEVTVNGEEWDDLRMVYMQGIGANISLILLKILSPSKSYPIINDHLPQGVVDLARNNLNADLIIVNPIGAQKQALLVRGFTDVVYMNRSFLIDAICFPSSSESIGVGVGTIYYRIER